MEYICAFFLILISIFNFDTTKEEFAIMSKLQVYDNWQLLNFWENTGNEERESDQTPNQTVIFNLI